MLSFYMSFKIGVACEKQGTVRTGELHCGMLNESIGACVPFLLHCIAPPRKKAPSRITSGRLILLNMHYFYSCFVVNDLKDTETRTRS